MLTATSHSIGKRKQARSVRCVIPRRRLFQITVVKGSLILHKITEPRPPGSGVGCIPKATAPHFTSVVITALFCSQRDLFNIA